MALTRDISLRLGVLFARDCLDIAIREDRSAENVSVLTVHSKSANPPAIEIYVPDNGDTIDVFVGVNSHYEIGIKPRAWRQTGAPSALDELEIILLGLMENGFTEELYYSDGKIVKSHGTMETTNGRLETSSRNLGALFLGEKSEHISVEYSPLCPQVDLHSAVDGEAD